MKRELAALILILFTSFYAVGQKSAQTGSLRGVVRGPDGEKVTGVTVLAAKDGKDVLSSTTDRRGEFTLKELPAGLYRLTFRKQGLSTGTIDNVEVKAGKTKSLRDRLIMSVDEGSLAFIRGSIFDSLGLSVRGVKVELSRLEQNGQVKKIDSRLSDESGTFSFRLQPVRARYRILVFHNGEPLTKDVEVDGAEVYRYAFTLPKAK
jgi:hypothetical protein